MMLTLTQLFIFITAFVITFLITPVLIYLAKKYQVCDLPDGQLKKQRAAVPYLGGVAVYLGFVGASVFFYTSSLSSISSGVSWIPLWLLTTLLLFLGLWDDLYVLSPKTKLFGQILVVALCLIANIWLGGDLCNDRTTLEILLLVLWFLTIINAFNLIDVMDGLASTVAIMFCATLVYFALANQNYLLVQLLCSMIGAIGAFLYYNFPPARIYLGDSGSLMLGGLVAYLPFMINWTTNNKFGFVLPIILLAIPLLELTGLIVIRCYKRLPIYLGSSDHFSHYLQKKGWGRRQIIGLIVGCAILFTFSSISFFLNIISVSTLVMLGIGFNLLWCWLIFS